MFEAFLVSVNPYRVRREKDPQTGECVWYAQASIPPPLPLRLHIGECIHNLRATLDNIMWELGRAVRDPPPDNLDFPVCWTEQKWRDASAKLAAIPMIAHDVVRRAQPYPTPEPDRAETPLYVLNRLWNEDKHRAPAIVLAVATGRARVHLTNPTAGHSGLAPPDIKHGPFEHEREIARARMREPYPEADIKGEFAIDIAFDERGPAKGFPVSGCLRAIHKFVQEYVLTPLVGLNYPP